MIPSLRGAVAAITVSPMTSTRLPTTASTIGPTMGVGRSAVVVLVVVTAGGVGGAGGGV